MAVNPTSNYAEVSLKHAEEHIFERVSVARDYELMTEALRYGRGRIRIEDAKGQLAAQEAAGRLLRHEGELATMDSLQREQEMVETINRDQGRFEPLCRGAEFIASDVLRPEQKRAVEFVLGSRDLAVSISGAAGTGKTATLKELRRGLAEAGRNAIAVAPTMSAVAELQAVGFTGAVSLERLLQDPRCHTDLPDATIILDEAGMVSCRQMAGLIRLAKMNGARIVFTGDTRQIQSVEAGDALRVLEDESKLKSVSLREVQRQTNRAYRTAIERLRSDPENGFEQLDAIGAVKEVGWTDRAAAAAEVWASSRNRASGSVLIVCATHDEIGRVTDVIRDKRKAAGQLHNPQLVVRDEPLGWTTAQKSDWRGYRLGQVLAFHRAVKGIERNTTVEVVRIESTGIVIRDHTGTDLLITRKQVQAFEVFERRQLEVAAGDQLLLTANRRHTGFQATNGEIVRVSRVDESGRICLEDGRVVPLDYTQYTHGYAVTAHRSQGKTVDEVIVSADGMSRELFYVAASRGRERITVVTSDADALRVSVGRSGARQSATELARKTMRRVDRGIRRGLEAAFALVARARVHGIPGQSRAVSIPERSTREYGIGR